MVRGGAMGGWDESAVKEGGAGKTADSDTATDTYHPPSAGPNQFSADMDTHTSTPAHTSAQASNPLDPVLHATEPPLSTQHPIPTPQVYDAWLLEKKVRNPWTEPFPGADEENVGDSCCFGTRTVEMGMDFVWRLDGGFQ